MAQRPDRELGKGLIAGPEQAPDERLPDFACRAGDQDPLHFVTTSNMNAAGRIA
jgi:hypothetical protein